MSHKFNLSKNSEISLNHQSNKFPKKASNYSLKTEATTLNGTQDYKTLKKMRLSIFLHHEFYIRS